MPATQKVESKQSSFTETQIVEADSTVFVPKDKRPAEGRGWKVCPGITGKFASESVVNFDWNAW